MSFLFQGDKGLESYWKPKKPRYTLHVPNIPDKRAQQEIYATKHINHIKHKPHQLANSAPKKKSPHNYYNI